jgi:predicted RecA/RadA family phage recombinase
MATFIQNGDSIDYTPGSAVASGDVIVQGGIVGVALTDIAANTLGSLAVRGIFEFAKTTGSTQNMTAGLLVYWDDSSDKVTTVASGNTRLGHVVVAAGTTATTVKVLIGR